jgi:hypothetical protein
VLKKVFLPKRNDRSKQFRALHSEELTDIDLLLLLHSEIEDAKWAGLKKTTINPYIILMVKHIGRSRRRENITLLWNIRGGFVRMGGGWNY